MSHLWKIEDFLAEITHLQELCARRPGSTVVQTLLNTLCQRPVDTWTSEAIIQLLDHVEKSTLPETEKATLNQCVESLATPEGAQLASLLDKPRLDLAPCRCDCHGSFVCVSPKAGPHECCEPQGAHQAPSSGPDLENQK